ncbi:MAG: flagellar protein FlaG [Thermodesulfobacteriota bacterium]|nr:flagellar protein FlaG [Thermodesulfobacteriota bacterium]
MDVTTTNINIENVRVLDEAPAKLPSTDRKYEENPLKKTAAQDKLLNKQEVKHLTEKIQDGLDRINISLQFSTYGENDERTAVTVTDKETGEVIRKIPPEELQQLYLKMNELTGMLFNHAV